MEKEKKVFKTIFLISLAVLICVSGLFFVYQVRALEFSGQSGGPYLDYVYLKYDPSIGIGTANSVIISGVGSGAEDYDAASIGYVKSAIVTGGADGYINDAQSHTAGGDLSMAEKVIINIGDIGTAFSNEGGLTLAGTFDPNGTITLPTTGISGAGTGSGLDADLLDGLELHTGRNNETNKVVRTDGNGYIQAGWINTTSGSNGTTAPDRIYGSSDAYLKYYTPANFATVMEPYFDDYFVDGSGSANYVPKFTAAKTLGNSIIYDNGTNVGIGTTSPGYKLDLKLSTSDATDKFRILNSNGAEVASIDGTGKLTVDEMDPPYNIDGVIYATYGHSTTGLKEETVGKLRLQETRNKKQDTKFYSAEIDFDEAEKESDLWLFKEITAFGDDWNDLVVILTPEGKADVWYEFIPEENKIIIYGERGQSQSGTGTFGASPQDSPLKVSYRLMAPRFDWPERDTNLYNQTGKAPEGVGIFVR